MRRLLAIVVVGLLVVVLGPPLFYAFRSPEPPELPPAGITVELSDGTRVNALDIPGDEPALVLVHGSPGSAYDWRPLPEVLARSGRRVIAYDRKGYGHSPPRPEGEPSSYASNASDLLAFLEALDLEDATIVGWSFGGGTAIAAASRDPSRIGELVLVGSVGPTYAEHVEEPPLFIRLLYSGPARAWIARVPPASQGMAALVSQAAFSFQEMPEWWLPQLVANVGRPHARATSASEGEQQDWSELDPARVPVPILVVHGSEDLFVPLAVGEDLAAAAREGELVTIDEGSHMIPITHAEEMAAAILAFSGGGAEVETESLEAEGF